MLARATQPFPRVLSFPAMKLYGELAPWFHLLSSPESYAEEAEIYTGIITGAATGELRSMLELGSGGGNNALHLKQRFEMTLSDLSDQMLELSKTINPELEHHQGDMRTFRLGRRFDAVFIHDAIGYLLIEEDLGAAIVTAREHLRPGGVLLVVPDNIRENFEPETDHGGHDAGGKGLRYLEWTHDINPDGTTYMTDYVVIGVDGGEVTLVSHDRHTLGVFPEATWLRLFDEAGFDAKSVPIDGSDWSAVAFVGVARTAS